MSKTLKTIVEELLNEADSEVLHEFFSSEMMNERGENDYEDLTDFLNSAQEEDVNFEHEDNYGGEGQGDDYWSVYKFTKGTESVFVKFNGWYASYNGSEYSEWFFVKAVPKTGFDFVKID